MRWIGLTGGISTGKSTVAEILRAKGYPVVDADQLAREVVQRGTEGHEEVTAAFGPDSVSDSGELNRKKIGEIVFRDSRQRAILEQILHPRIRALAETRRRELESRGLELAFYDVPLLFEKSLQVLFDRTVVVVCEPEEQIRRLMVRDGFGREEAERRLAAQMPIEDKVKLADDVIRNEGSIGDLESAVDQYLRRLGSLFHQAQT
jgi:dephospho-CoA kinase